MNNVGGSQPAESKIYKENGTVVKGKWPLDQGSHQIVNLKKKGLKIENAQKKTNEKQVKLESVLTVTRL